MTDDADAADRRERERAAIGAAYRAGFSRLHPQAAAGTLAGGQYVRSVNGTDADLLMWIPGDRSFACRHRAAIGEAKPVVVRHTNGTIADVVAEVLRWSDE